MATPPFLSLNDTLEHNDGEAESAAVFKGKSSCILNAGAPTRKSFRSSCIFKLSALLLLSISSAVECLILSSYSDHVHGFVHKK